MVAVIAVAAVVRRAAVDDDDGEDGRRRRRRSSAQDYAGNDVEVVPGEDGPLMLVFLAHWCPHCNAEIPVLQQWEAVGRDPRGPQHRRHQHRRAATDAPNYPPDEWLADDGLGRGR